MKVGGQEEIYSPAASNQALCGARYEPLILVSVRPHIETECFEEKKFFGL